MIFRETVVFILSKKKKKKHIMGNCQNISNMHLGNIKIVGGPLSPLDIHPLNMHCAFLTYGPTKDIGNGPTTQENDYFALINPSAKITLLNSQSVIRKNVKDIWGILVVYPKFASLIKIVEFVVIFPISMQVKPTIRST